MLSDTADFRNTLQVIKIDVEKKEVYKTTIVNSLQGFYNALSVDMIEVPLQRDNHDVLVVDEEALVRDRGGKEPQGFFFREFPHQVIFGHGIICGQDNQGDWVNCQSTLEEIQQLVVFPEQRVLNQNWQMLTGELLP